MLSIRVFGEDITKPHHATLKPATTGEQTVEAPAEVAEEKAEQAAAPAEEDEEAALNV